MDILNDIKRTFKEGGILIQLIYINTAIFVLVNVIDVLLMLFLPGNGMYFGVVNWFAVPSGLHSLLLKPWTPLTYMFLHKGFMHILFNMLWLYWFGKLFIYFIGEKRLLSVYIYGGLAGAALFIAVFNLLPFFTPIANYAIALGASASIMAIVVAVCFYKPDYEINLMFIGNVKLKYIGLITVGLDLLSAFGNNAGGHIAHLGGALLGYYFIKAYRNGKDWSIGFNRFYTKVESLFKSQSKMHVSYRNENVPKDDGEYNRAKNQNKKQEQKELDQILEKISKHGYTSLNKEEKDFLFKQKK